MNVSTLQKYEAILKKLHSTIQAELDQSSSESAPVAVDGRMGRISRGDAIQVQQMALEMNRRRKNRLQRIQTSLQRIQQGTYGFCGRCNNPIGIKRLDVFPDSVLCIQCAT